ATLQESDRTWVLGEAASTLRAQGRLAEALPVLRAALRLDEDAGDWGNAAASARNLSEAGLVVGEISVGVATAERSVVNADRSGVKFHMISKRVTRADALHAAGERADAADLFADAERRQKEHQPKYPLLYSVHGFRYCDLLLAKGDYVAAR